MGSHKERNNKLLLYALLVNAFLFFLAMNWSGLAVLQWDALARSLRGSVLGFAGVAFVPILNGFVSADGKAILVFWRLRNALPGSRVFSELAPRDPRVSISSLREKYGELPNDARAQNEFWYKLYKSVEDDVSVATTYREYLYARDYASIAFLLSIILIVPVLTWGSALGAAFLYVAFLWGQYMLVRMVAETYGNRFATTVLAVCAAKP